MPLISDNLAVKEGTMASHVAEVEVEDVEWSWVGEWRGRAACVEEVNTVFSAKSLPAKAITGGTVAFVYLSHSCVYGQTLFGNIIPPLNWPFFFSFAATLGALPCRQIGRLGINSCYLKLAAGVGETDLSLVV